MAKKKGKTIELGIAMPTGPYKEPSAAQVMKRESHYMAENVMRAHPKVKKMKNEIARAIEGAVKKHLGGGSAKSGRFGE